MASLSFMPIDQVKYLDASNYFGPPLTIIAISVIIIMAGEASPYIFELCVTQVPVGLQ